MNISIDNLSHGVTEDDLRRTFEVFGQVTCVKIILVKFGDELRGFGFVEMPAEAEAQTAINILHDSDFRGKALRVKEAPADPEN
jgi:RNA recognition motif-containing protein